MSPALREVKSTIFLNEEKRNILIVDDDVINQKILGKILEGLYQIAYASDGLEALDYMRSHAALLSAVLLDITMPKMDGLTVLHIMKADPRLHRIPVIVLSGRANAEVQSLQEGARDFISKPYSIPEVIRARVANIIQMAEDSYSIRETERDWLTGLYTKEFFFHYCTLFDLRHKQPKDAIVLDIDHFKLANAMYGKDFCDRSLQILAVKIDDLAEKYGGIAGRLDGDTFLLYLVHGVIDYETLASQINDCLKDLKGNTRMHIRIGIYDSVDEKMPIEVRFDKAHIAGEMVRDNFIKAYGLFDVSAYLRQQKQQLYIGGFEKALNNHEFSLHFQPQYDISTEPPKLVSAEALIRWNNPAWGQIPPAHFIPLFEQNGLIHQLDLYVWNEAARQVREWKKRFDPDFKISVNVSKIDIYSHDLVNEIQDLVRIQKIDPEDLALEITESAYTSCPELMINKVNQLRSLGFKIEMDNFGSGYSSLNILTTLPFDVLKIDMKYFKRAGKDALMIEMIRLIVEFATYLNAPVIAEGVETREMLNYLKAVGCKLVQGHPGGCRIIQGYLFCKPLPAKEFEKLFLQHSRKGPGALVTEC